MRRGLLHLAALAACLTAGCGREAPKEAAPLRIVSTSAAATHILLALGAEEELAAIDSHGSIVPGAEHIPVAGRGSVLSLEELTRLRVNRAVLWYYQRELATSLRDRGIAVTTVPPLRLGNYAELVQRLGELTDRKREAQRLVGKFQAALPAASEKTGPKVYWELYGPGRAVGEESYFGDLLRLAGAENCAAGSAGGGSVSLEAVVARSPEVILFMEGSGSAAEIAARPGLAGTPAVKSGRIHPVDRVRVLEGVDPAGAVRYLHELIHRKERK